MSAPLFDAVTAHAKKQKVSMHMPAHKGKFPALGDILSSLSDEDMKALGDAARSLLGSPEQEQGQNDSDRGFSMDPATMAKIAQIMSAMNRHDSRCDLIAALRPLLSEPRRRRADDAMQLIKLIDLLPMIEDLGRK